MFRFTTNFKNRPQEVPANPGVTAAGAKRGQQPTAGTAGMPADASGDAAASGALPVQQAEARMAQLRAEAAEMMKKYPDFQVKEEMENPVFVEYVFANGLSMEEAYVLTHFDKIAEEIRSKALEEMSANRERIMENGAAKNRPARANKSPKDLSDDEVDEIIERVRKGEKVTF